MNHCENWSTLAYTKASLLMSPPTLLNVTPVKVRPEAFSSMLAERTIGLLPLLDLPDSATMVVSVMQRIINGSRCCWAYRWIAFLMLSILRSA